MDRWVDRSSVVAHATFSFSFGCVSNITNSDTLYAFCETGICDTMASMKCASIAAKPAMGGASTLRNTFNRSSKPAMAVNMRRSVVVKAEESEFVTPTLNPSTPSPIFGGSTVLFDSVVPLLSL